MLSLNDEYHLYLKLEKALSGSGGKSGSDVSTRIFGTILTWMQEKTKPVFVVATANDITGIPPEFMRKGRFDEIFFVDFPTASEIIEILKIHLKKRDVKLFEDSNFNEINNQLINILPQDNKFVNNKQKRFSGADVEAVVKEVVENIFVNEKTNALYKAQITEEIIQKLNEIKTLEQTMPEKVKDLKNAQEKFNAKQAS